jgi:hypothetical protein
MHVDVFQADGSFTYTGDGVVEERTLLLERLEISCRERFVHFDFRRSRIGRRKPNSF